MTTTTLCLFFVTPQKNAKKIMKKMYRRTVCKDGFSMSIQGSENAYCTPRDNDGPYTHVEIGFPSAIEDMIIRFADEPRHPGETVYSWVPSTVVLEVLQSHGGWVSGEIPPMVLKEISSREEE
jgi:hypothetical protein